MKLEVNTTTGATRLRNSTPFNMSLDFYSVTSANGSLNVAGWNSLESPAGNPAEFPSGNGSGNGWEAAGKSAAISRSPKRTCRIRRTLAPNSSATLGNLFSVGESQDLAFRYRAPDGVFYDATVEYVRAPVCWGTTTRMASSMRRTTASGVIAWEVPHRCRTTTRPASDADDYTRWKQNFGQSAGTGSLGVSDRLPFPSRRQWHS